MVPLYFTKKRLLKHGREPKTFLLKLFAWAEEHITPVFALYFKLFTHIKPPFRGVSSINEPMDEMQHPIKTYLTLPESIKIYVDKVKVICYN